MAGETKPLAGVRVVEFGTLIAGPFCSRILAEFGAEVVKVEAPGEGDPLRGWRRMHDGTSLWWYAQARNKKSLTLNLKHPDGLDIARKLVARADIVIENFRPGVMEKLGLGWDALSATHPGLIMVRLSGFGQTGPMREQAGFGAIGESMGGLRYVTGYPDQPPVKTGVSIGDSIAALWGAIGALMALRHRDCSGGRDGGVGQVVDVALYEAVFSMMESLVPEYAHDGFIRERTGNVMPGITPSNTHAARDGAHVIIGGNGDAIFKRLMQAVERPDLADDPQLAGNAGRDRRAAEIYAAIDDWVGRQDADTVLSRLTAAQVPVSRVFSVADMFSNPQYLARGMIESWRLADGTEIKLPGIVPRLSATPGATEWPGPALGEHNEEILAELGYSRSNIQQLRNDGVI
jgi:formyl-CoA transferase